MKPELSFIASMANLATDHIFVSEDGVAPDNRKTIKDLRTWKEAQSASWYAVRFMLKNHKHPNEEGLRFSIGNLGSKIDPASLVTSYLLQRVTEIRDLLNLAYMDDPQYAFGILALLS